jgi:hemerythrin-like domain-containing protein
MKAAYAPGQICETIKRLESDHEEAGTLHAKVDALLKQWLNKGLLGPTESRELLALFEKLQALYLAHIRTEDREVFPLAAELLSEDALAAIGHEMRARRGIAAAD